MENRRAFALIAGLTALAAGVPAVCAEGPRVLAPTLGRPQFVAPGGSLEVTLESTATAAPRLALRSERFGVRIPLSTVTLAGVGESGRLAAQIPANAPPVTYDLEVRSGDAVVVEPHCVAVGDFGDRIRIVQLPELRLGDPAHPSVDPRLIATVNALAPTLIIASGNYVHLSEPDVSRGWSRLRGLLSAFDAPVVLPLGDEDAPGWYSAVAGPSPLSVVPVGPHRVVLAADLANRPLAEDAAQLNWLEKTLAAPSIGVTIVVSHSPRPSPLIAWQKDGSLTQRIRAGRVGLWLTGPTDTTALDPLDDAVRPMLHLAAPGNTGGFRVFELSGGRLDFPGQVWDGHAIPPPLGSDVLTIDLTNESAETRRLRFVSSANFAPRAAAGWAEFPPLGGTPAWCENGVIEARIDAVEHSFVRVRADVPDRGATDVLVGRGQSPAYPTFEVRFAPTIELDSSGAPTTAIQVKNTSPKLVECTTSVRLAGRDLAHAPESGRGAPATAYRLRLAPGQEVRLRVHLPASRFAPPSSTLQLYLRTAEIDRVFAGPVRENAPLSQAKPDARNH